MKMKNRAIILGIFVAGFCFCNSGEAYSQTGNWGWEEHVIDSLRLDSARRAAISVKKPNRVPANVKVGTAVVSMPGDSTLILNTARQWVNKLTSAEFAGRGYQLDGHTKAATWIAGQFKNFGLKNDRGILGADSSYFQKFKISINLIDSAMLAVNGKLLEPGVQYIVNENSGKGAGQKLKLNNLEYGLPEDFKKFKGGVALFREGLPQRILDDADLKSQYSDFAHDVTKAGSAIQKNAPAVVVLKKKLTASFSTLPMEKPIFMVLDTCWPAKVKTVNFQVQARLRTIETQNVIGVIKGSFFPDSVIIVSAHYDHLGMLDNAIFPGANDNASGISMLLSLASHFSRPANQPKCTMVFIAFAAEEAGLFGSRHYADKDPSFPLTMTKFILNLDLLGNGDEGIVAVAGADFPVLFDRLVALNEAMKCVPIVKPRKNAPNSDHYPFVQKGVKGFFIYTLGGPPHYHDVNDTAANLRFSKFFEIHKLLVAYLGIL